MNQDHDHGEGVGMALGFRIFEDAGQMFYAEAEITPYVDEPNALGATLVFHPLNDVDPTAADEEMDWPALVLDIDDDLKRAPTGPVRQQFQAILGQLSAMSEGQLREYLQQAREESEAGEEEEEESA
ncbi:hypothetical protein BH23GEM5_BH23GEM5_12390 [soil metagenome]